MVGQRSPQNETRALRTRWCTPDSHLRMLQPSGGSSAGSRDRARSKDPRVRRAGRQGPGVDRQSSASLVQVGAPGVSTTTETTRAAPRATAGRNPRGTPTSVFARLCGRSYAPTRARLTSRFHDNGLTRMAEPEDLVPDELGPETKDQAERHASNLELFLEPGVRLLCHPDRRTLRVRHWTGRIRPGAAPGLARLVAVVAVHLARHGGFTRNLAAQS